MNDVRIKVSKGAVIVNDAFLVYKTNKVALISIDMASKYSAISATGKLIFPVVMLEATEHTLGLDSDRDKESVTTIEFIGYEDYDVFSCDLSRYTLRVTLLKKKKDEQ